MSENIQRGGPDIGNTLCREILCNVDPVVRLERAEDFLRDGNRAAFADSENRVVVLIFGTQLFTGTDVEMDCITGCAHKAPVVVVIKRAVAVRIAGKFTADFIQLIKSPFLVRDHLQQIQIRELGSQQIRVVGHSNGNDFLHNRHIADGEVNLVLN